MPRQYSYQYETSPRKIKPEYIKTRKKTPQNNQKKGNNNKTITKSKVDTNTKNKVDVSKKKEEEAKKQKILTIKTKASVFVKCVLFFIMAFFLIFMNSQISQSFSQIQKLKAEITELQKENDQIEINIQNSTNLNNIEKSAKELLGMQKLSSKQTFYISLSKKDYVEPRTEEIIIEEETPSIIDIIIEKIKNIF